MLATQTLLAAQARTHARHGRRRSWPPASSAKDVILAIIAQIGAGGGTGHVIEYAGAAIRAHVDGRAHDGAATCRSRPARASGMVAPDDTTFAYSAGRPFAPRAAQWAAALADWRVAADRSRSGVRPRGQRLIGASIAPMVTWGTSPHGRAPITGRVPDPAQPRRPRGAQALAARARSTWGSRRHAADRASRSTASSSARAPTAGSRICAPPPQVAQGPRAPWCPRGSCRAPALMPPGRGGRGPRPRVHRGRLRVARGRLLDVRGDATATTARAGERWRRPPTATSRGARARARARTSCRRRWRRPPR